MTARPPKRPAKPKAPAETSPAEPAEKSSPPAAAPIEPQPDEAAVALKPFAQALSRRAIEALAAVMSDSTAPPAARISAATTLLTWGHGRPQGEGECAQPGRAEPVIRLRWASEAEPAKGKAKRRRTARAKPGAKPAKS